MSTDHGRRIDRLERKYKELEHDTDLLFREVKGLLEDVQSIGRALRPRKSEIRTHRIHMDDGTGKPRCNVRGKTDVVLETAWEKVNCFRCQESRK